MRLPRVLHLAWQRSRQNPKLFLHGPLGRESDALQAYEEHLIGSGATPDSVKELRLAHAKSGWGGYWKAWLSVIDENSGKYFRWHDQAEIYDRLGQPDKVIECLTKSIENREYYATGIRSPNSWKAYRFDPRFQSLLRMLRVEDKATFQVE